MKIKIQQADVPNKNNRIYPKHLLEKISEEWTKTFIVERRAFVCKKSIIDSDNNCCGCVNLKDVVGIVKNIGVEDDWLIADVECLPDIPSAKKLFLLLENGYASVRMSGISSLNISQNGNYVVADDYELISLIITENPA